MLAAKWRQMRCWAVEVAILDITMERMAGKIAQEFVKIDHAVRTALAYIEEAGAEGALALNQRQETRMSRMWHRALRLLRDLRENPIAPSRMDNAVLPNEPEPGLTPVESMSEHDLEDLRPGQQSPHLLSSARPQGSDGTEQNVRVITNLPPEPCEG